MEPRYECNCDTVIGMQELGVGTEEILQYAAATLPRDSLRHLISELEVLLDDPLLEKCRVGDESESPTELSEVAG